MDDPYRLQRFVDAQAPVMDAVLAELANGEKRSHWMWFVFPQVAGLGRSPTAQHYAIGSMDEARAFLANPVLGERLRRCTERVNAVTGRSAHDIFGSPDDRKFQSSMTLFKRASDGDPLFAAALERYFVGRDDPATLQILDGPAAARSGATAPLAPASAGRPRARRERRRAAAPRARG